ncbi:Ubiquitin carboxyl-terminal hydrolase [Echinococcus multilocularis]|uniref:Ubiquitin carboxyl-terminal hydrolase n=1 Tax=Echinococcus multilocularis TaxID=6211 RepID=A0A0S4MIY1_ECHMU|nr:Ubiquitin carboxyl-terminal hydrolase [Echinococcus multilocularis]
MDGSAIIQSLGGSQPDNHISVDMYTSDTAANMSDDENGQMGDGNEVGAHNRRKEAGPSRNEAPIKCARRLAGGGHGVQHSEFTDCPRFMGGAVLFPTVEIGDIRLAKGLV